MSKKRRVSAYVDVEAEDSDTYNSEDILESYEEEAVQPRPRRDWATFTDDLVKKYGAIEEEDDELSYSESEETGTERFVQPQHKLVPQRKDPRLWIVRTGRGKEREICMRILERIDRSRKQFDVTIKEGQTDVKHDDGNNKDDKETENSEEAVVTRSKKGNILETPDRSATSSKPGDFNNFDDKKEDASNINLVNANNSNFNTTFADNILSVIVKPDLVGYIYIESYSRQAVIDVLQGLKYVSGSRTSAVPLNEMIDALTIKTTPVLAKYAKIKRGKYKNEVCEIKKQINSEMVKVAIVPQISTILGPEGAAGRSLEKIDATGYCLFNPKEHNCMKMKVDGEIVYIKDKNTYCKGFLIKEIPIAYLNFCEISFEESKMFDRKIFKTNDLIKILKGDLQGLTGKIISVKNDEAEVQVDYLSDQTQSGIFDCQSGSSIDNNNSSTFNSGSSSKKSSKIVNKTFVESDSNSQSETKNTISSDYEESDIEEGQTKKMFAKTKSTAKEQKKQPKPSTSAFSKNIFKIPLSDIQKHYHIGTEVSYKNRNGQIVNIQKNKTTLIYTDNFTETETVDINDLQLPVKHKFELIKNENIPKLRRDYLFNKYVELLRGKFKGLRGTVKDVYKDSVRILLDTTKDYVTISKQDVKMFDSNSSNIFNIFAEREKTKALADDDNFELKRDNNAVQSDIGKTPMYTSRGGKTPGYRSNDKFTSFGGKTPSRDYNTGGKTPNYRKYSNIGGKTPSSDMFSGGKTPNRSYLDSSAGKTPNYTYGHKTPNRDHNIGGKTPVHNSDNYKTSQNVKSIYDTDPSKYKDALVIVNGSEKKLGDVDKSTDKLVYVKPGKYDKVIVVKGMFKGFEGILTNLGKKCLIMSDQNVSKEVDIEDIAKKWAD
ncbi:hypothetical protein EDEG_03952 [Edhazardia aedis USNM 41457]|uniref:Chromatin elongation factor SPT5 n=1 Tax=Edhazardia aedis (strain USNM 41457) TaxID=1003232 RepID=J9D1L1_EDHAE|nr:hypothetical protein EDEG_03952 [Edhazardia aedis USNM 41457]|eukprot:EJW01464.1 hypothetical protein EDEG_03952 [Edhazardia aedis USNM 41457]